MITAIDLDGTIYSVGLWALARERVAQMCVHPP